MNGPGLINDSSDRPNPKEILIYIEMFLVSESNLRTGLKMQAMDILKGHIQDIKSGFAVKRIGIYGSFSRGEEKESSDIDILVEFEKPTFRNFMNLSF